MANLNDVIQTAKNEVGYLEKKSNANLDHPTKNAGKNNYTKYNRDYMAWDKEGLIEIPNGSINMQWCAAFVSWCFVMAYGQKAAAALLCGGLHCYTPTGAGRFKNQNRYIKRGKGKPQPGDVVFFYSTSKGRIGHVGIVYKVTSSRVYTIEGNTSGGSTLITNGGSVAMKSYSLTSTYIDGYGRPDYAGIESGSGEAVPFELGERLLANGSKGDDVQQMQEALISLGFSCGSYGADGDFGDATELAVIAFQRKHGLDDDGEYGPITHTAVVKALEAADKSAEQPRTVTIAGGDCWARTAPSAGAEKLGVAKKGKTFNYGGQTAENGWLLIEYNNKNAWVSGKYGKLA